MNLASNSLLAPNRSAELGLEIKDFHDWRQLIELETITVEDIQAAIAHGEFTSVQLVQLYLDRIAAYDKQRPAINALITVNPRALEVAAKLDEERQVSGIRGLLHGIPIILKDNYDTADLPTTAGSMALANSLPLDDGFVVSRLRAAGAIILAKANMSEFALSCGRLGYSSAGGLTLNPYDLTRNASGSSSGTAAAITANFAVLGMGTDTAGSIREPAAVTGLVGLKPTLGLVSRDGIVPLALSFDTAGPMTKTVVDAAVVLNIIAGSDPDDPRTLEDKDWVYKDYTQFLSKEALAGSTLGIAHAFMGGNLEVDRHTEAAITQLEALGATVVEVAIPENLQLSEKQLLATLASEFKPHIETYLNSLPTDAPKSLRDLIVVSQSLDISTSPYPVNPLRIAEFLAAEKSVKTVNTAHAAATIDLSSIKKTVLFIIETNKVDALIYPTTACPASPIYTLPPDPKHVCNVDNPYQASYLASLCGFPAITVPMGSTTTGLPLGLSFMAEAYSEPKLLAYAYAFEQSVRVRRSPTATPPLFNNRAISRPTVQSAQRSFQKSVRDRP